MAKIVYVLLGHQYECGPRLLEVFFNRELAQQELRRREYHYSFCTIEEKVIVCQ